MMLISISSCSESLSRNNARVQASLLEIELPRGTNGETAIASVNARKTSLKTDKLLTLKIFNFSFVKVCKSILICSNATIKLSGPSSPIRDVAVDPFSQAILDTKF